MIDLCLKENGRIIVLKNECFSVPFTPDTYGFFIETDGEKTDVDYYSAIWVPVKKK